MRIQKQILTTLLTLLLSYASSQQQISFNKLYFPDSLVSSGYSVLTKGSGYIINAIENDSLNRLLFIELDSVGNEIRVIRFLQDTIDYYTSFGTFVHTHDGGYCFAGDIHTPINMYHYFVKFDSNLDTLWTKKILQTDTLQENERQLCETFDRGFVMVGEKWAGGYITDVLLLKIDSLGNQLWRKTIATGGLSAGWQIRETPDKGLLIQGFKASIGNPFIMKTDSLGNFKWLNSPNSQKYNGGGAIALTPEGDYLFAYGYNVSYYPGSTNDYYGKINIIKYNPQGGVIWNKFYDTISIDVAPMRIDILPNGNFYVLSNYLIGALTGVNQCNALLMKFHANGDSLWTKRYSYTGDNNSNNILYDGVATNDGGFIGCGYAWGYPDLVSQIWVVKTDSNGYAPGMQYLGINEINPVIKEDFSVHPNPAKGYVIVDYRNNTPAKEILLVITDMQGRLQKKILLNVKFTQNLVDVHNFVNGMYNFTIFVDGKQKASNKIVIQN